MSSEFWDEQPSLFALSDPDIFLAIDDTDNTSKQFTASILKPYIQTTWVTNQDAFSFNLSSLDVLTFANDTGTITSTDYGIVRNGSSLTFNVGDTLDSYFLDFNGTTAHTFTNTTLTSPNITLSDTLFIQDSTSNPTADGEFTNNAGDVLVFSGGEIINLSEANLPVPDTTSIVEGSADATKQLRYEIDGFTTGNTRILTPPDADGVIVLETFAQTLTNKTLTTPTIGDFTNANHDHSDASNGGQLTNSALVSGDFDAITGVGIQGEALNMGTNLINNVVDPVSVQDAATKNYVDTHTANAIWTKSGTNIFPTTLTDSVGIGINTPESLLDIAAGTSTIAPLKLNDGTLLTNLAEGSLEFSSDDLLFTSNGGLSAFATVTITADAVTSVNVTNGGSGYTSAPPVVFDNTGTSGTGATATAVLTGDVVTSVTVDSAGSGYTIPPTVSFTDSRFPYRDVLNPRLADTIIEDAIETWNAVEAPEVNQYQYISWSPELGLFAAVSNTGTNRIMTSPDGINWTARAAAESNQWQSIVWSPELRIFAATSSTGFPNKVMTSPDGIIWTAQAAAADNNWNEITWSPEVGLFVAISVNGSLNRVMTSPDGEVWTSRTTVNNSWRAITWSPEVGLFVAVAASGTNLVMTSPDGITWTTRSASVDNSWLGVVWASELGLFVATASSGTGDRVMTSPDGINWTTQTSAADNTWNYVTWSPELGILVAVAGSGTGDRIMTSPDGINWTTQTNPEDNTWNNIVWSPELGLFAAVSNTGTNRIMTSTIPIPDSIFSQISVGLVNDHPPSLQGTTTTDVFSLDDLPIPVSDVITLTTGTYFVKNSIDFGDNQLDVDTGAVVVIQTEDPINTFLTFSGDDNPFLTGGDATSTLILQDGTYELTGNNSSMFDFDGGVIQFFNSIFRFNGTGTQKMGTMDGVTNFVSVFPRFIFPLDGITFTNVNNVIMNRAVVFSPFISTPTTMMDFVSLNTGAKFIECLFNLGSTSAMFDFDSSITVPITIIETSNNSATSLFYAAGSLDETSIYVTASFNTGSPDSKNIGSVVVNNNAVATPTTSNTFVDLILSNPTISEGSNIEQWELTDDISGTNAELTYLGLTDFNGVINATITIDPNQNNRTYAFRIVVDGSPTVDAIETTTLLSGSTIVTLPFLSPLLITTGQTLRIQLEEVGNSSSPVITDLVIQAQNP